MNQIERDLTYRLDALKETCNQYGPESYECKVSMEIWQDQHNANLRNERLEGFFEVAAIIVLLAVMLSIIASKLLKHSAKIK